MTNINLYILPILVVFLFVDISIFTIFDANISALLLCLYTIILLYQNKKLPMALAIFFVSLQFFVFYGNIYLLLSYLIPISLLARWAKITIRKESVITYVFLAMLIMIEQVFVAPYVFGVNALKTYTFYKICGNILMLAIFLKYLPKGKLGDRL